MRRGLLAAAAVIAIGVAAAPAQNAPQSPSPQQAAPAAETGTNPSAQPQGPGENRKSSGTADQSGPSDASPTTDPNSQADRATHSVPGRAGKEEPGSHAPTTTGQGAAAALSAGPALLNGKLNVEGAPQDGQTVPAKYSPRNDEIDKTPIVAMSLRLTDEQKRAIAEGVKAANAPAVQTSAKVAEELPWQVPMQELPPALANDPALAGLKYVRTSDRILLVAPQNRIVVGEVAGAA
jgi:hypothetical protein